MTPASLETLFHRYRTDPESYSASLLTEMTVVALMWVRSYLHGDSFDRELVADDVTFKSWRKLPDWLKTVERDISLNGSTNRKFTPWFRRIVKQCCMDELRKTYSKPLTMFSNAILATVPDTEKGSVTYEKLLFVCQPHQELLDALIATGSIRAAAKELGISVATAERRVRTFRERARSMEVTDVTK